MSTLRLCTGIFRGLFVSPNAYPNSEITLTATFPTVVLLTNKNVEKLQFHCAAEGLKNNSQLYRAI